MAKRKNITPVPTWQAQWIALTEGGKVGNGRVKGNARRERRRSEDVSRKRDKKKRSGEGVSLSFSLSDDGLRVKKRRCGFYAGRERTGRERRGRNRGGRIRRGARFSTKPIIRCVTSRGRDGGVPGVVVLYRRKESFESFVFHATRELVGNTRIHGFTNQLALGLLALDSSHGRANWFPVGLLSKSCKCANHNVTTIANYFV